MKKVFITFAFVVGIAFLGMAQSASNSNPKSETGSVVASKTSTEQTSNTGSKAAKSNCGSATTGSDKKACCQKKASCGSSSAATKED